jgi:glyceraldehyde 3-phosphate dehydrogenase
MNIPAFGINGFGRIGRTSFRVWWEYHRQIIDLRAVNTSGSMEIEEWVHLLKYDSNYGVFNEPIRVERHQSKSEVSDDNPVLGMLFLGDRQIVVTAQRDPKKIPWGEYGVQMVVESTGAFTSAEKAAFHFEGGAQKVVISAPAKGGGVFTSVLGVNETNLEANVISNASCTTNCIAPVAQIMVERIGVEKAMLTTIHSYTDDQNLHDNSHSDLRRARAAALNIVPTTTGAATAAAEVVPALQGLFDGLAIRVPTPTGSLSDVVFVTKRETSIEEINNIFEEESHSDRWRNILAVTREPIVSSDIIGRMESSIVDLSLTNVVGGNLVKVISWYDNEWGYCHRLIEQVGVTLQAR